MIMPEKGAPLIIVTYHDIYQWIIRQRDGWGDSYQAQSAMVRLSPVDLKNLGLSDGDLVELVSEAGAIVVKTKLRRSCQPVCTPIAWQAMIHRTHACLTLNE
jgi:formylmethanofuran dehydrogenase subunit D